MDRMSDMAFQCWTNSETTSPNTALLAVKDGVYFDHYLAAKALRERMRRFSNQSEIENEVD